MFKTLCHNGISNLAVDGAKLIIKKLFGLVDDVANAVVETAMDFVATLADNFGKVRRATTIPRQQLKRMKIQHASESGDRKRDRSLTLGVPDGMSESAFFVAIEMSAFLSFLGEIISTA